MAGTHERLVHRCKIVAIRIKTGANAIDVAMLDVNLNGSKSYPVADALAVRGVPFLFATGYSDHGLRDLYRDRPVLKKPYKPEELIDSLEHLLS